MVAPGGDLILVCIQTITGYVWNTVGHAKNLSLLLASGPNSDSEAFQPVFGG